MTTANEEVLDASIRHQIGLRRYSAGVNRRIFRLLEEADRSLVEKLRTRLNKFKGQVDFTSDRWLALLKDVRAARLEALREYRSMTRAELVQLGKIEADAEAAILTAAIPIEIVLAGVASDQLRAIVSARPFQGRLLKDWYDKLERDDAARLTRAIQLGMVNQEPIDDIVRTIVGTRAAGYTDGVLSITRRDASTIVRTAVNHVSNVARSYVWDANSDIISARIVAATLDGRTTVICRTNDGRGIPMPGKELPEGLLPTIPPGLTFPAHMNCRTIVVAYIDGVGLVGTRPTVTDTRTRRRREIDFRAQAKATGKPIQQVRREWADEFVGRVPAPTNYENFLSRQPVAFQDDVLGITKGRLFRKGGLKLDQFVDRRGKELTIDQLAAQKPDAFIRAGLDPDDF